METERPIEEMRQRFDPLVSKRFSTESDGSYVRYSDFAKKDAENKILKEEITRLKMELEEAKRQVGRSHGDILMYSAVDALLHQAKSLSTLIFERDGVATRFKNEQ